jgi:hypothetical protein
VHRLTCAPLLHDKACLLVVDDAWQADSVRPFLVGGPRCRVLVTTRDATLARKVGARLYDLDVMTEPQALALFEARLGPLDGDREQAAALARELGHLPLALELAAAQVEGGVPWEELLEAFRRELANLAALDLDEATYRNESLRISFRLSLERLSLEDRAAFAWLGVLPEDARINPLMTATLWDQPEAEARKRLWRLRDKALLKSVGKDCYMLHDLIHDETKLRLTERMSLPEAHVALLDRYRVLTREGLWHTLSDDSYIHAHLTWHLEQASQADEVRTLLCEETAEGRNGWYEACERLGQTAGYLQDVARAWRLAEEEFATRHSPLAIGLQCRYALVTASLNSLAKGIRPPLLSALVEKGVWSPVQGLAYACQAPDSRQRATALASLAPYLAEPLLREALAVARTIEQEYWQAWALAGLLRRLARLGYPAEALAMAREIGCEDRFSYGHVLSSLAPYLSKSLVRETLVQEIESISSYARTELLGRLAELGDPEEALAAAREIQDEDERAKALAKLAPHLPKPLLHEALAAVREICDVKYQAHALAGLASRLAELGDPEKGLATVRAIHDQGWQAVALVRLAPHLPKPLLQEALAAAQEIYDVKCQAHALAGLAPYLPEPEREQILGEGLAAARAIKKADDRAKALAELAPHFTEPVKDEILREALAAARGIKKADGRAKALVELTAHFTEPLKDEILREALAAIRETEEITRSFVLLWLTPYLPGKFLREALTAGKEIGREYWYRYEEINSALPLPEPLVREELAAAREIRDEDWQARALVELVPHLPEPPVREVLAAAQAIRDEDWRAQALVRLAPHLPEPLLRQALAAVRAIRDEMYRARALAELAPHLPESEREQALWEELAAARSIEWKPAQAKALAGLALRLAELGHTRQSLAAVQEIRDEDHRARALAELTPHLPESEREQALREALAAAQAIWHKGAQAKALAKLAPHLPELLLQEALATAREIQDGYWRAEALIGMAPHLPELLLREVLAAAREIESEWRRAEALAKLTPRLAELGCTQEALVTAQGIRDKEYRARALAELASHLPESEREIRDEYDRAQVLAELARQLAGLGYTQRALAVMREIHYEDWQAKELTKLVLHLPESKRDQVLQEALAAVQIIGDERHQAKALAELAPHLPESLLWDALMITRAICIKEYRARALAELAPHLPESEREVVLGEALAAAQGILDEHDRMETLTELAPYLPELLLRDALVTTRAIRDKKYRARALAGLAPYLTEPLLREALAIARTLQDEFETPELLARLVRHIVVRSSITFSPLWCDMLHALACLTRGNLLSCLRDLDSTIVTLGGPEAAAETVRAIQDVGGWWP